MAQRTNVQKNKAFQDMEMEVMTDMYDRLTTSCYQKCTAATYPETSRGDLLCMDKCMKKYLVVYKVIGDKLSDLTMQD